MDLIGDPALDQAPWEGYHGLKELLKRTGKGSVMLHYYDEIHLPLLVFPFTFHIDEMSPFFIGLLDFFSLRTVIKKYVPSQLKTEFYLKIFKLTLV